MTDINYFEETRRLQDLKPYHRNPRYISVTAYEKLKQSLKEEGYCERIVVNKDNTIVSGHQRAIALQELGYEEIKVLVPDRPLTPQEYRRKLITSNISFGENDMDIISSDYDLPELKDWGFVEATPFPTISELESQEPENSDEVKLCKKCPHR